jgi:hypothetical protein
MSKDYIPQRAIRLHHFEELDGYYRRFAKGHYNFMAVVGNAGLAKTDRCLR